MRHRILVLDDSPNTLESLREAVDAMGHAVQTATNVDDALALFAMNRPAAMLLGLPLPARDGVAVFTALRRIDDGIPIIIVTGSEDDGVGRDLLHRGAFDYIHKPVDLDHLAVVLGVATTDEWPMVSGRATTSLTRIAFRVAATTRRVAAPDADRQRFDAEAHAALTEALAGHPRTALEHLAAVRRLVLERSLELSLGDLEALMGPLEQLRAYLPQLDDGAAIPAA